jgi:predicted HicB family RNase H-like nuclease
MPSYRRATALKTLTWAGIILLFSAAVPAQAPTETIRHYVIVNGDSMSGSWDSNDGIDGGGLDALRARFGRHFAWFRQGGHEYVVTDAAVLAELDKAMEPQKNVNRMQAEVNRQQSRVNGLQARVNAHQADVNALQGEVNRRQQLVNQIQAAVDRGDNGDLVQKLEAQLRELRANRPEANQANVNRMQSQVNQEQAGVNAEQAKVNAMQQPVNDEQRRVSAEFSRRVQEIFHSALQRAAAQQVK